MKWVEKLGIKELKRRQRQKLLRNKINEENIYPRLIFVGLYPVDAKHLESL